MRGERGTVYLIHFHRAYHHARHYLGWTADLSERIDRHASGNGSPLVRAVTAAGIGWTVVRTWVGVTRDFERHLHKTKAGPRFCPVCLGR